MHIQEAIKIVMGRGDLSVEQMESAMNVIMTGEATPAQVAGFLVALRMKGETTDEITGAVKVMRALSSKVELDPEHLVDTCGTGGDSTGTVNVSTASAFVAAAAGCRVAKHGNRSVSSKSGSADLLEKAGVNLSITPEQVKEAVDTIGIGFMFAPAHHSAMKHAIGPRKELAARTIFNLLGPLTNPAGAPNQVIGTYSKDWLEPLANVLKALGSRHVMLVSSEDGQDEISVSAPTDIVELKEDKITKSRIKPEDFGISRAPIEQVQVEDSEASLLMIKGVFEGAGGPASDLIALNSGAAIYCAGLSGTIGEGVMTAQEVIKSGKAKAKFEAYIKFTQKCAEPETAEPEKVSEQE